MSRPRYRLKAALIAFLVGVPLASASGETVISKSTSYFTIGGRTAAELDKALAAAGPMMKNTGARHPGATRIKFGGTITYVSRGGSCAVGSARVTLSTRLILPRWKHRRQANRDLALVWDTLAADIKRHEERHAEIARIHAREMEKALLALKPEPDCERMQTRVTAVSAEEVERHDKDQARFDRVEATNFDRRMIRLLQYRLESLKKSDR